MPEVGFEPGSTTIKRTIRLTYPLDHGSLFLIVKFPTLIPLALREVQVVRYLPILHSGPNTGGNSRRGQIIKKIINTNHFDQSLEQNRACFNQEDFFAK